MPWLPKPPPNMAFEKDPAGYESETTFILQISFGWNLLPEQNQGHILSFKI
jgi:hypothetical protein